MSSARHRPVAPTDRAARRRGETASWAGIESRSSLLQCSVFYAAAQKTLHICRADAKPASVGVRGPQAPEKLLFVGLSGGCAARGPHKEKSCEGLRPSRSQRCISPDTFGRSNTKRAE